MIWEPGDVLFNDGIHRLPMAVEEVLYSAMEDLHRHYDWDPAKPVAARSSGIAAIN